MRKIFPRKQIVYLMIMLTICTPILYIENIEAGECQYCPPHGEYGDWIGDGDDWCGVCEDQYKTRSISTCTDGTSGSCTPTQKQWKTINLYSCHAPDGPAMLGCYTVAVACAGLGIGVCGALCITTGEWTGGQSCYWCIVAALGGGGACLCAFDECKCPCEYDGVDREYKTGC